MVELARTFEPMPDEILDGYISRLAIANGASSARDFRRHVGLDIERPIGKAESLRRLADITAINQQVLSARTVVRSEGWAWINGEQVSAQTLYPHSPRYCPHCVRNDLDAKRGRRETRAYIRANWIVTNISVCPTHATTLFTSAVRYDLTSKWDFSQHLYKHNAEFEAALTAAQLDIADDGCLYFSGRLNGNTTSCELLDPLPYYMANRICEIVGKMVYLGNRSSRTTDGSYLIASRRAGFRTLSSPVYFLDYLSELNERYIQRNWHTSGFVVYGALQEYLTRNIKSEALRPMINMVRKHAMDALPIGPDDMFIGGGGVRKWHTIHTAMLEYGVHEKLLRKTLIERDAIPEAVRRKSDNKVVFSVEEAEKAVAIIRDGVSIQYIKEKFSVQEVTVRRLINAGALVPSYGRAKNMYAKFSKTSIDAMLERVVVGLQPYEPDEIHIPLMQAIRHVGRSFADLLLGLVQGTIFATYVSTDLAATGFNRILVDIREVKSVFAPPLDGLTRQQVRQALGVTDKTVNLLFESGLFETVDVFNPVTRWMQIVAVPGSFQQFRYEHASLYELARGWTQPAAARRHLDAAGVVPAFENEGSKVATFYKIRDVIAVRSLGD